MRTPARSPAAALWAVVPVKRFAAAKRRLSPLLAPHECAALARAMLVDVLQVLVRSRSIAGILVVTDDPDAAALAGRMGAEVTSDGADPTSDGADMTSDRAADRMLPALTRAMRRLADAGCTGALILPADIPGISVDEVEALVDAHRGARAVTLVPAHADGGSNALACTPPQAIALHFGDDSFRRHCAAARRAGIEPTVLALAGIGLDIDRPSDLVPFLARATPTRTYDWLMAAGIAQRLPGARDSAGATVAGTNAASASLLAATPDAALTP